MKPLLSDSELFTLLQTIKQSNRIVICAHRGPDGDAVGSSLGWAEYLQQLGKKVTILLPNPFPDFCDGSPIRTSYNSMLATKPQLPASSTKPTLYSALTSMA